jgi:hypothetical protein
MTTNDLVALEEELRLAQRERDRKMFKVCIFLTLTVGVPMVGLAAHHASLSNSQRATIEHIFN